MNAIDAEGEVLARGKFTFSKKISVAQWHSIGMSCNNPGFKSQQGKKREWHKCYSRRPEMKKKEFNQFTSRPGLELQL